SGGEFVWNSRDVSLGSTSSQHWGRVEPVCGRTLLWPWVRRALSCLPRWFRVRRRGLKSMTRNFNGVYQAATALSSMGGMLLPALLLAIPLMAIHFYAREYVEPAIESSSDCKDPNTRPGSRAEKFITIPRPQSGRDVASSSGSLRAHRRNRADH